MKPDLRTLSLVLVLLGAACSNGPQVRVLSSEPTFVVPQTEAEPRDEAPRPAPRIGAPGGSGSGSRSVIPAP